MKIYAISKKNCSHSRSRHPIMNGNGQIKHNPLTTGERPIRKKSIAAKQRDENGPHAHKHITARLCKDNGSRKTTTISSRQNSHSGISTEKQLVNSTVIVAVAVNQ